MKCEHLYDGGCPVCHARQQASRWHEYFSHSVSDIPAQAITEKEVKGERVDKQVKLLEGK